MKYIPSRNITIKEPWYNPDCNVSELQRKEVELKLKEKEINKRDKILQRKIAKYNRRKGDKAKADLRAAAKLKHAKKKLLLALDTRDRIKSNKKRKKNKKDKRPARWNPLDYFNNLINKPCECSRRSYFGRYTQSRDSSSYLQRLFGRPCPCKHNTANANRAIFRLCEQCGREPCGLRQDYRERAAGDCYLMTMRRPPQPWIYHRWPQFYPHYLGAKQQCKNCGHVLLFLAGIIVWTPCFLCLELCKCCFCACCSDC